MNNLDKLIQLATIEQMYSMLNKMKSDFNYDELKQTAFSDNCHCSEKMVTNFQDKLDSLEKFTLKRCQELEVQNNDLRQRLIQLEDSFKKQEEKMQTQQTQTLQTQVEKGQKLLTEYVKVIEEPIKLNIEEKQVTIPKVKIEHTSVPDYVHDDEVEIIEPPSSNKLDVCDVCNEGLDNEGLDNEGLDNEGLDNEELDNGELGIEGLDNGELDNDSVCSFPTSELALKPDEQTEEAETHVEDEQEEETNVEEQEEQEEEQVEEQEEETNVEEQEEQEEQEEEEQKSEDELQSVETEEKQEDVVEDKEEEEGEEVFEIEIDDVTYFATDEENGVIYEMTKDGDIGKKVGVIKDGEPVFNI
jgi:hypothetical protein